MKPERQRMGLGTAMMEHVMRFVENSACPGAIVGLMSAHGKEAFYERFGFWRRPVGDFGHGMMQFWGARGEPLGTLGEPGAEADRR